MFSDNEKISLKQLRRLLVFDLFSISALIIPRIAVTASGKDGILSILLAFLFELIYAWIIMALSKNINGNFIDFSKKKAGSIITFAVGALFIVKLFACSVFAAKLFSDIINQTLLEDTDNRLIILLLLAVSAYAASKGFEIRARIAEILFYIVIVPIIIFLLLGLKNIDYTNLMPIFTESPGNIIEGGYLIFLTFSMLELLLFTIPLVSYKKYEIKQVFDESNENNKNKDNQSGSNNKSMKEDSESTQIQNSRSITGNYKKEKGLLYYIIEAFLIVSIINVLFYIVTVGILGVEETSQKLWSSVTIIQIIKMPGRFIQRQDAVILSFWMMSIFTIMSGFFYYICLISKQIFRVTHQNYLIIPFLVFLFGASVYPIETEQYFNYFEKYMTYIGMPQSILLPAFIVFISRYKKNKALNSAVKSMLLLLSVITTVTLTGCGDLTEIEDRNFVQAMGVDLDGNDFTVYYQLPDLKALTGQGGGGSESENLMLQFKGTDFWEMEDKYNVQSNKKLDFSHIKAIIIGKSLTGNPDKLEEFLLYVKDNYELARNTYLFLSESSGKDIISLSKDISGGIGDYLERLYTVNLLKTGREEVTVGDMIQGYMNEDRVIRIPMLKKKEKNVVFSGLGMFTQKQVLYTVKEEKSNYINIACGYGKNSMLFIKEDRNQSKNNADQSANDTNQSKNNTDQSKKDKKSETIENVIKISSITRKLDFRQKNNKPFLSIKIDGKGTIQKGLMNSVGGSKTENSDTMIRIENKCNEQIKKEIDASLTNIMKKSKVDFMNLYRMTGYKDKRIWLDYKGQKDKFLDDLEYTVDVNISLNQ